MSTRIIVYTLYTLHSAKYINKYNIYGMKISEQHRRIESSTKTKKRKKGNMKLPGEKVTT